MKDTIDLGMAYDDMPMHKMEKSEKHYPSFHYSGPEELRLPKSGTMTVRFKEVESSHSDRDGQKTYSCTVEIRDILDVEEEKDERPAKSHDEASGALDRLMAEKMARKQDKSERY